MIRHVAAICLGGGLGCLAHLAAHRMSGLRSMGMFAGSTVGFGITILTLHLLGVPL